MTSIQSPWLNLKIMKFFRYGYPVQITLATMLRNRSVLVEELRDLSVLKAKKIKQKSLWPAKNKKQLWAKNI